MFKNPIAVMLLLVCALGVCALGVSVGCKPARVVVDTDGPSPTFGEGYDEEGNTIPAWPVD